MYTILIIDDEPMICHGLKALISNSSLPIASIDMAHNGEEALQKIVSPPDIIITDIRMPRMDGISLVKEIRERNLDIKVIALSGYDDFEYVRQMAVLGIENYLLKPVNENELFQTLTATMKKLQKEQEHLLRTQMNSSLIKENIINRWIYGSISERELHERADFLNLNLEASWYQPCIIRILGSKHQKDSGLKHEVCQLCTTVLARQNHCYYSRNYNGDSLGIFYTDAAEPDHQAAVFALNACLDAIMEQLKVKAYVLLGKPVENYWDVAASFERAVTGGIHLDHITDTASSPAEEAAEASSPFSLRLAQYVLEHFDEDLSLKTLASHFKGNAAYIGQLFKRDMHQSFSEYLKTVRIEKAKDMLCHSSCSAKEIASKVGFQNTTYFSTVFKEATGLSPAEYKKTFST